jgi:endogenous inhibitor of DNA gyrase (YacG/DUF329 family)
MSLDPSEPDFKPYIAERWYKCADCGHEVILSTNHNVECYPYCKGKCRQIMFPHTAREVVLRKQTTHKFLRDVYSQPNP